MMMNKDLIPYYLYILGTVTFTVYGQLILKWRIGKYGQLPDTLNNKIAFLFNALLDPFIFSGLLSAFIASLFWIAAVTKFDISFAYPLITAGLLLMTTFMAIIILGESLNQNKIIGISLILAGILFMARDA